MTTVGVNLGFALPPLGLEEPPMASKRSGVLPCWAPADRPEGWPATPWSMPDAFEGRGLLRMSLSVEVEDEGVSTGDELASREEGDAVPSLGSLFFLVDLLPSLFPRESCGRIKSQQKGRRGHGRTSRRDLRLFG